MNKPLSQDEEVAVAELQKGYLVLRGKELPHHVAVDYVRYHQLLRDIASGTFVCNKCGETQALYQVYAP